VVRWIGCGALVLAFWEAASSPARAQFGPAPVVASPLVEQQLSLKQTFVGTVQPVRKSAVGSAVDGRVLEYPAKRGVFVKAGSALAQLKTETIRSEIAIAEAELRLWEQELAELKNGTRPAELEQAEARRDSAEAAANYAAGKFRRLNALAEQRRGAISEEEMEESRAEMVRTQQAYRDAAKAHELAKEGPRPEKILQGQARVEMQREMINKLEDQFVKHTMISPFDGYVTAEHTQIGEWVTKGQVVAEVIDLSQVEIEVHVPQDSITQLELGSKTGVLIAGISEPLSGEIAQIVPTADVRSRTFPVIVRVSNLRRGEVPVLKGGMIAQVELILGAPLLGLVINKDAIVLGGPTPLVYVVDPEAPGKLTGKVRPVPVKQGRTQGQLIQVSGPLKAGELVVIQGNERLRPGQPVVVTSVVQPEGTTSVPTPAATSKQPETK